MKKNINEVSKIYESYRGKCSALRKTYAELNRDKGADVMMSAIGGEQRAILDPILITRDDYEDIKEYARFIGVGLGMDDVLTIIEEEQDAAEEKAEGTIEAEWSVVARRHDGREYTYSVENGPALYWWPSNVHYADTLTYREDLETASLYHKGELVETTTDFSKKSHSQAIAWDDAWD